MTVNPNSLIRIFIAIFLFTMAVIAYYVYQHVMFLKDQRKQLIHNYYDSNLDNITYDLMEKEDIKQRKVNRYKILKMKADIKEINLKQNVYNADFLYGITNVTFIIVIQVHSNVNLLKQLLASLKTAHSIASALLIFSHDVFDTNINDAVRTVNFARYMQIFYPYSVQLHPYVYPGAENTDYSVKSRDPMSAQKKLHWWWQVNQVFDHIEVTKNYSRTILFLEENNYVSEDFLIVLKLLEHVREVHCPVCELISLGAHKPEPSHYFNRTAVVALEIWAKDLSSTGIAFDRVIWHVIKSWGLDFCNYNDYTWENSLKYIGAQHMDINFYFTAIVAPRVICIEECKTNERYCNEKYADVIKNFTTIVKSAMYPALVMLRIVKSQDYVLDALGSFNDERDHELCMFFTKNSAWF